MGFPSYNKALLITASIFLIPLIGLTLYMQPLSHELTRMGGYLENDYGWNSPQEHFEPPLFKKAGSIDDYGKYYDVVVLGDSFSDNESYGWQNYFVNETGLKTISFNMFSTSVDEIIGSPVYLKHPPKLFIYESVERSIPSRHNECNAKEKSKGDKHIKPMINMNPLNAVAKKKERDTRLFFTADKNIGTATNYITKYVARNIFSKNITEVEEFNLNKTGLFSSKINDSILVLTRDFKIKDVNDKQIETAKCSLLSLQDKIRLNNKTEFIAMVFPNKTSVYSKFMLDISYSKTNIASKIEDTPGLNIAYLFDSFVESVGNGVVDFYLPNDTHCGYYAYKQAAKSVITILDSKS